MIDGPGLAPVRLTIVIPAHDEQHTIGRNLHSLTEQVRDLGAGVDARVIVVANGCTDRTVEVSRGFAGVEVLDLPAPSKIAALRAADAIATSGVRIYLDADVVLEDGTLEPLIDALSTSEEIVAAPTPHFDAEGASWVVRRFYGVFEQLPYVRTSLGNAGVYGLSPSARGRFGDFPDIVADDLFVQSLFAAHERVRTSGLVAVRTPRTLGNLLQMRSRVARGNAELAGRASLLGVTATESAGGTVRAMGSLARSPSEWPGLAVYVGVTLLARQRARRSHGRTVSWERDTSTRA